MRVALYGGSFNPPHMGHVLGAAYLTSAAGFDRVLVVPVFEHAFDKSLLHFDARVELCNIAFATLKRVEVCTIESELPRPSYTISTVEALLALHRDWQLEVVVGADVLPELPKWHRFNELLRLVKIYAMGRRGYASIEGALSLLPEISSSELRARLREPAVPDNEKVLRQLLPADVLTKILAHGYYR